MLSSSMKSMSLMPNSGKSNMAIFTVFLWIAKSFSYFLSFRCQRTHIRTFIVRLQQTQCKRDSYSFADKDRALNIRDCVRREIERSMMNILRCVCNFFVFLFSASPLKLASFFIQRILRINALFNYL